MGILLFGLQLTGSILWFLFRLGKKLVIDRPEGFLWKGGQSLAQAGHVKRMPLEEVWAVQLISEFVSPDAFETYMIMSNSNRSGYDRYREMEHRVDH